MLLVLGQRVDRDKVGTGNTFPVERYLESSMLAPSCDLPWIDDPYSTIGCDQGGNHKRWYLVLRVEIRRGLWDLLCGDTQCMDKKASKKIDTQKQNGQLLSLGPEKSRPEIDTQCMDLQADKSPVVVKGPFFPRVLNPRYRIRGTMCNARIQSSKARKALYWRTKLHLI
jgi:hypothetical protein